MNILRNTERAGQGSPGLRPARWKPILLVSILTLFVLAIHGYHPYAEDGGLYVAGVKRLLNPRLYPAYTSFVTEHLRFSLFAPLVAALVRLTRIPLPWILLGLYAASAWLTLYAAWALVARSVDSFSGWVGAVMLLACLFCIPIAGTSLMLMDPYVTARSLSTPLTLLALAWALDWNDPNHRWRRLLRCTAALMAAALVHPLMAGYGVAAVLVLLCAQKPSARRRWSGFCVLAALGLACSGVLQATAPAESAAYVQVAMTRYYWFPFRWQWYEQLGLIAPLALLAALLRWRRFRSGWAALARCATTLGAIALVIAVFFARAHFATHLVARMQPLRCFQIVYEVMILLLGAWLGETWLRNRAARWALFLIALGSLMFFVDRQTFPGSAHLELPWRAPRNPWVEAFIWVRQNTPNDAVFALPAHYITTDGEDAQCFRAIAERSALPDYSKDGGEASITPSLTGTWFAGQSAQSRLDRQTDGGRIASLAPFGATWIILERQDRTAFACPYTNEAVKVCRLP